MDIVIKPGTTANNKTGGWRTYRPQVDADKCIGCSLCAKLCPENIITMKPAKGKLKAVPDFDYCKGCGVCAAECPVKAVRMDLDKK
jgi:2-oxoacid:acceptor oxidoreductase delta subunit (pyruvate/2-ketoisovalerate family)